MQTQPYHKFDVKLCPAVLHPLYDKDNKKYIEKGEYIIQVKNNISSNENKLIIN